MSSEATPIVNPNLGTAVSDPDVIRHTHYHEHPEDPGAHVNFPDGSHLHTHIPSYQHHRASHGDDNHSFIERWNREAWERKWARSDQDHRMHQPAGRDERPGDQAGRDTAVRQPDREPDAGAPAVSSGGAVLSNGFPLTHTFANGSTIAISDHDAHTHRYTGRAYAGTIGHPTAHPNTLREHRHPGYGPAIYARANARADDPAPATGGTAGAPAINADDADDQTSVASSADAAEDRRRAKALRAIAVLRTMPDYPVAYPRKDEKQEGSQAG